MAYILSSICIRLFLCLCTLQLISSKPELKEVAGGKYYVLGQGPKIEYEPSASWPGKISMLPNSRLIQSYNAQPNTKVPIREKKPPAPQQQPPTYQEPQPPNQESQKPPYAAPQQLSDQVSQKPLTAAPQPTYQESQKPPPAAIRPPYQGPQKPPIAAIRPPYQGPQKPPAGAAQPFNQKPPLALGGKPSDSYSISKPSTKPEVQPWGGNRPATNTASGIPYKPPSKPPQAVSGLWSTYAQPSRPAPVVQGLQSPPLTYGLQQQQSPAKPTSSLDLNWWKPLPKRPPPFVLPSGPALSSEPFPEPEYISYGDIGYRPQNYWGDAALSYPNAYGLSPSPRPAFDTWGHELTTYGPNTPSYGREYASSDVNTPPPPPSPVAGLSLGEYNRLTREFLATRPTTVDGTHSAADYASARRYAQGYVANEEQKKWF